MLKKYFLLLLIPAIFFSACNNKQQKKELLRINIVREPMTLDHRKAPDVLSTMMGFVFFDGLMRLDNTGKTSPAIAKSYEISEDLKTYTFHLRDTCWSNGEPVTAYDFEKSWKDVLDPDFPAPSAHLFYVIKNGERSKQGLVPLEEVGIYAPDEKTFVVELEQPTPFFLELTSFSNFFPVNSAIDATNPNWMTEAGSDFICNGPFVLTKWTHEDKIVAEKNPNYWNQDEVSLNGIEMFMVNDEMTALNMFQNRELDMIGAPMSHMPIDAIPELLKTKQLNYCPLAKTTFCNFNVNRFPFTNKNIRKAFAYAIDRRSIVDNIMQLNELVGTGLVPPILKGNHSNQFFKDNDKENAKLLLKMGMDELGITLSDLQNLTYSYFPYEANHNIAQALQQRWKNALDINVKLEQIDKKILLDMLRRRDYDFAQTTWHAQYTDQISVLDRFKKANNVKNHPHWENREFTRLIDQSYYDATMADRAKTLEQAEQVLLEDMPLTPLFHMMSAYMLQPEIKNFEYTPIGFINFNKIKIEQR